MLGVFSCTKIVRKKQGTRKATYKTHILVTHQSMDRMKSKLILKKETTFLVSTTFLLTLKRAEKSQFAIIMKNP